MSNSNDTGDRRNFLGQMACGAGLTALAAGGDLARAEEPAPAPKKSRLPREVWIATVAQEGLRASNPQQMVQRLLARMESVVSFEPDIVCLPEEFALTNLDSRRPKPADVAEKPGAGPLSQPIAEFAGKHHCYVICPMDTRDDEGRCYNAAVLFDRAGQPVGEYRKMHPTINEMEYGITPGTTEPPVFKTDFGTIGIQICYDMEWPHDWRKLRAAGAEIIFFPSAFAAGAMVNSQAWMNKVCVVSSTNKDTSKICDITGEELGRTTRWNPTVCAPVNLEKVFIHTWPGVSRFPAIEAKYGRKIRVKTHGEEEWTIIESLAADVKVADVLAEFGLKSREEVIRLATNAQNAKRPPA